MPSKLPITMLDMSLLRMFDRGMLEGLGCVYNQRQDDAKLSVMLLPGAWYNRIPDDTEFITILGLHFVFRRASMCNIVMNANALHRLKHLWFGFPPADAPTSLPARQNHGSLVNDETPVR